MPNRYSILTKNEANTSDHEVFNQSEYHTISQAEEKELSPPIYVKSTTYFLNSEMQFPRKLELITL